MSRFVGQIEVVPDAERESCVSGLSKSERGILIQTFSDECGSLQLEAMLSLDI